MDRAAANLRRALVADPVDDDSRKLRVRRTPETQVHEELAHLRVEARIADAVRDVLPLPAALQHRLRELISLAQPQEPQAIGHVMNGRNNNFAGKGLADAVRRAREKGMTWEAISVVLGLSHDDVLQRFGDIDKELAIDDVPQPAVQQQKFEEDPPMKPDFSALQAMSMEELSALGKATSTQISSNRRGRREYDVSLREAIVITLYQREVPTSTIAAIIGRSSQRISQIISDYYSRIEAEWEAKRNA